MKKIKVKTRNSFKKLHSSKKVNVSSTQWTAFRSIQFLLTNAKLCLYKKSCLWQYQLSLSSTPFPANSSTGLIHKCLNLWIFLTMSEFPDPEQGWHSAQPKWEADTLQHRGQETTGQKWEHCSATANHCSSWNGLKTRLDRSQAPAIIKEPYRQKSRKVFSGLESNDNSLIFIYLWSSEELRIYVYIYIYYEWSMLGISTHKSKRRQNENMQISAFIAKTEILQPSPWESMFFSTYMLRSKKWTQYTFNQRKKNWLFWKNKVGLDCSSEFNYNYLILSSTKINGRGEVWMRR